MKAIQSNGQTAEHDVSGAPSSCSPKGPTSNQAPTAQANGPYSGIVGESISFDSNGSNDPDGSIVSYAWSFGDGGNSSQPQVNPAGVSIFYSAAANPNDPILGKSGVVNGLKNDGSTYKTNFWDTVAQGAYDPFYPALVTPLISGLAGATEPVTPDVGLPVPSVPTDALTNAGLPVVTSLDDPDSSMPTKVSVEYAADINILRLHDLEHGADYVDIANQPATCDIHANGGTGDANCLTNKALVQGKPVVCQVCHYTPALDLAQVGPVSGPPGTDANGRNQLAHQSNSRVMHNHHGQFTDLFPAMPAPIQAANGSITNQAQRVSVLENTCYQCHPGKSTQCLRGAMFNAGMLCNDCHGDMTQVGNDFSKNVSPSNPGAFVLNQGNFYTPGSSQPRVLWANEPSCGSCHTGTSPPASCRDIQGPSSSAAPAMTRR